MEILTPKNVVIILKEVDENYVQEQLVLSKKELIALIEENNYVQLQIVKQLVSEGVWNEGNNNN